MNIYIYGTHPESPFQNGIHNDEPLDVKGPQKVYPQDRYCGKI